MRTERKQKQNSKAKEKSGAPVEDRSKGAGASEGAEKPRSRAGAGGDDRSKDFGGLEDYPKA